jgi:hypothetical protein
VAYEMKDNNGSLWVNDRKDEDGREAVPVAVGEAEDGHRAEAGDRRRDSVLNGWSAPGWKDAAAEYHVERGRRHLLGELDPERLRRLPRLLDDSTISFDRTHREVNAARLRGRAATSEVEALEFSMRKGIEALMAPAAKRRLSELSEDQLREVRAQLKNFKPNIAPVWTPEEVEALVIIWSELNASYL